MRTTALKRQSVAALLTGALLLVLLAAIPAFGTEPKMRVHLIDVGQGDATLLEFPCGAILVDTGGEKNGDFDGDQALMDYLDGFFLQRDDLGNRLHSLVLTHPHIDHTRAVLAVLEKYPPLNAVTDGRDSGSGKYGQRRLRRYVEAGEATADPSDDVGFDEVSVDEIPAASGLTNGVIDPINCESADPEIKALWGRVSSDPGWGKKYGKLRFDNENNHSVVLRVDFGEASILLTGDIEDVAITDLCAMYEGSDLLDVDVLRVSHHGSKNGTTEELLDAVSPELALISMGPADRETQWTAWQYGHPNAGIIGMLEDVITQTRPRTEMEVATKGRHFKKEAITDAIYATGWDGPVVLEADMQGNWVVVEPASEAQDKVDVNVATLEQLDGLPSIGLSRARAIIDYREAHGPFASVDALIEVRGIGPATLSAIRPLVTTGG